MKRSPRIASVAALSALLTFSTGAPESPGAKSVKRAPGPTEITAREATFDNRTHEATFTGDVIVKDPEFGLSSDKLSVYMKKPDEHPVPAPRAPGADQAKDNAQSGGGIDKAIAEENVVITMDKVDAEEKKQRYIGRGRKAVFDNTSGILTLTGWPQIAESVSGTLSKQIVSREEGCVIIINRVGHIDVKGLHTTTLKEVGAAETSARQP